MRRTELYSRHQALGARFVEFGGWEMPVQYTGIIEEHEAVRRHAGLFDVSHMGEFELRGPRAAEAVQRLTVNDVTRLQDGNAQYSMFCLPSGGVVDDIMVHRVAEQRFMICVNASNTGKDFAWVKENCGGAEAIDRSGELSLLACQGPRATEILRQLTPADLNIPAFWFVDDEVAGKKCWVAHTGYTGEDGWEIYCENAHAGAIWDAIMEAGAAHGIQAVGLGARDTLRLERALPLYGHELTETTTPLEAGLSWVVRFNKGDFIGRDALQKQRATGVTRKLIGLVLTERGIPRQGYAVTAGKETVGEITSGTKAPTVGKGIGLGYVAAASAETGTKLGVDIRGRIVPAEVVKLPFYKRQDS